MAYMQEPSHICKNLNFIIQKWWIIIVRLVITEYCAAYMWQMGLFAFKITLLCNKADLSLSILY